MLLPEWCHSFSDTEQEETWPNIPIFCFNLYSEARCLQRWCRNQSIFVCFTNLPASLVIISNTERFVPRAVAFIRPPSKSHFCRFYALGVRFVSLRWNLGCQLPQPQMRDSSKNVHGGGGGGGVGRRQDGPKSLTLITPICYQFIFILNTTMCSRTSRFESKCSTYVCVCQSVGQRGTGMPRSSSLQPCPPLPGGNGCSGSLVLYGFCSASHRLQWGWGGVSLTGCYFCQHILNITSKVQISQTVSGELLMLVSSIVRGLNCQQQFLNWHKENKGQIKYQSSIENKHDRCCREEKSWLQQSNKTDKIITVSKFHSSSGAFQLQIKKR